MKKASLTLIWALFSTLFSTLLLSTPVFAHGGMEHILGTVTDITDHSLSVKTGDGAAKVEFDGETKFMKGDAPAAVKDVQVGSRVAIHAHKRDNSLHATEVRIGTSTARSQH